MKYETLKNWNYNASSSALRV